MFWCRDVLFLFGNSSNLTLSSQWREPRVPFSSDNAGTKQPHQIPHCCSWRATSPWSSPGASAAFSSLPLAVAQVRHGLVKASGGGTVVLGPPTTAAHPCCQVSLCILREHLSCSWPGPRPHSLSLRTEWPSSCGNRLSFMHLLHLQHVFSSKAVTELLPTPELPHILPLTLLCRAEIVSRALPKVCKQNNDSSLRSCWCDPSGDKSPQAKHPHPKEAHCSLLLGRVSPDPPKLLGQALLMLLHLPPPLLCVD